METFLAIFALVLILVVGNGLLLLRTAHKPAVPDPVKSLQDREDDDGG